MSTTTLRLPEALKVRIETLAAQSGDSAHAFMIKTLDDATVQLEQRREFDDEARRRLEHMDRTGDYIEFDELRHYARALAAGVKDPPRPALSKKPLLSTRDARVK